MATEPKKPVHKKPVQKKPVQKKPVQKQPASKKPVKHTEPVHTAKKKPAPKNNAKKKRTKIVLFVLEIFILLIMVVVLYSVFKIEKVGKVNLPQEEFVINPEVEEKVETTMKGYRNVALFGVDSTSGALTKNTRSDTIMIASINQDTGECKLVSVYRDTYLNLSNDSYNKCNSAYAKGGPMQAINMLNMNLDMNIKDFITVGFAGLSNTVDALGGIMIDIDDVELKHINNYQKTMASDMKREYTPVESTGYQLLDGLQATAYCRIRYGGGDDFKRTERQREVLLAIFDKAKSASPATLTAAVNAIFDNDEIYTSLDVADILDILGDITKYEVVAQGGFPEESRRATGTIGSKGSCVVPVSLADNVQWLHEFLFEDEEYSPSDAVIEYSNKVEADTSGYVK
ncbi:MAG: LytR family transcriptional regulator [Lachnospiraceae bacterium]|jgi:LCP family protein required for cell wall assembly|nr:LytR family transcriptional regulator [Lachnospiraceae bacterium]